MSDSIAMLAETALVQFRKAEERRHLIGITGKPGAGKSTLTQALVRACERQIGEELVIGLPMDGFHLTSAEIAKIGRLDRRGAPDTFDAEGFVSALRRIADPSSPSLKWPQYNRRTNEPVSDAITVSTSVRLIFVEGNYLLLPCPPWNEISQIIASIWYVSADSDITEARLRRRQLEAGKTVPEAQLFVERSDMLNAELVEKTKGNAERVVKINAGDPLLADLRDPATGYPILID